MNQLRRFLAPLAKPEVDLILLGLSLVLFNWPLLGAPVSGSLTGLALYMIMSWGGIILILAARALGQSPENQTPKT